MEGKQKKILNGIIIVLILVVATALVVTTNIQDIVSTYFQADTIINIADTIVPIQDTIAVDTLQ